MVHPTFHTQITYSIKTKNPVVSIKWEHKMLGLYSKSSVYREAKRYSKISSVQVHQVLIQSQLKRTQCLIV